jgi:heme/copper-type cytochrome/quinol oxidase subunit 2
MRNASFYMLRTLVFLGLVELCLPAGRISAQNQDTQVIEVTAKKYEYSPEPVHVKRGMKVQLKITATDHDHGFKIAALPDGAAQGGPLV